jgi:hypothetical protein
VRQDAAQGQARRRSRAGKAPLKVSSPTVFTNGLHQWSSPMVFTNGLHQWSSPMVFTNGLHQWSSP